MRRTYHVCILASVNRVLYVGVTGNLDQRLYDHGTSAATKSFTARYHTLRLVYVEEYGEVNDAIAREKQIKGWRPQISAPPTPPNPALASNDKESPAIDPKCHPEPGRARSPSAP